MKRHFGTNKIKTSSSRADHINIENNVKNENMNKKDVKVFGFRNKEFYDAKKRGEKVVKLIEKAGLSPLDFSYGDSGVGAYFLKLQKLTKSSDSIEFEPKVRTLEAVADAQKWASKSSKKRKPS